VSIGRTPGFSKAQQLEKMQRDWDARARENALYYVATGNAEWSDEEFYASGEQAIAEDILTDMTNICQGKDPKAMRVLEIGCGAGRLTRALANVFGEVHAVDVSGEMIARAQKALAGHPNAHVYQNNGCDLTVCHRSREPNLERHCGRRAGWRGWRLPVGKSSSILRIPTSSFNTSPAGR
jgi:methylase of polypeptide subunit release factors